jgi:hypothetical protein
LSVDVDDSRLSGEMVFQFQTPMGPQWTFFFRSKIGNNLNLITWHFFTGTVMVQKRGLCCKFLLIITGIYLFSTFWYLHTPK